MRLLISTMIASSLVFGAVSTSFADDDMDKESMAKVRALEKRMDEHDKMDKEAHERHSAKHDQNDRDHDNFNSTLKDHEHRLKDLETKS